MNRNDDPGKAVRPGETTEQYAKRRARELTPDGEQKEKIQEGWRKAREWADGLKAEQDQARNVAAAQQQAAREAQRKKEQAETEARVKSRARALYTGTDASFEADWPTIRAEMQAKQIAEEARRKNPIYREF